MFTTVGILFLQLNSNLTFLGNKAKASVLRVQDTPISLDGNTAFKGIFPGSGTSTDPYRIENRDFEDLTHTQVVISISNSDVYFVINNSVIHGGYTGILLHNVTNGVIFNNTIYNNSDQGIDIEENSEFCTLEKNRIYNNTHHGCRILDSSNIALINNTIYENEDHGVYITRSVNVTSTYNNITANVENGFEITATNQSKIWYNEIINNGDDGIFLESFNDSEIVNNSIINNGELISLPSDFDNGISLSQSYNCIIENNSIIKSGGPGIQISYSDNIVVTYNKINDSDVRAIWGDWSNNSVISSNNLFNNTYDGIAFSGDNNIFSYNIVDENNGSALTVTGDNCTSKENIIRNSVDGNFGIYLVGNNNTIINNKIYNNTYSGIVLNEATNTKVISNEAYNNSGAGLTYIGQGLYTPYDGTLQNNTIQGNSFYDSYYSGMIVWASVNSTFTENTIYNNSEYGIVVDPYIGIPLSGPSVLNTISNNIIYNNTDYGLYFKASTENNIVKNNDFLDNYPSGSQVYDNGTGNIFDYNYYNDWTTPDSEPPEGIVDIPYDIDGETDNQDSHPLTTPNPYHVLTNPTVIYPNGGETVNGVVTEYGLIVDIHWTPVVDSLGHDVTYALSYSPDGGIKWIEIEKDITGDVWGWNINDLADGSNYLVKVIANCSEGLWMADTSDTTFTVKLHTLSEPTVIYPNGGETVSGTVTVQWTEATDSLGHEVKYWLYISDDSGTTWDLYAGNQPSTSYAWDTTLPKYSDGANYLIKVVANCSEGLETQDISDTTFTIQNDITTTTTEATTTTTTEPTSETSESTAKSDDLTPTPGWIHTILFLAVLVAVFTPRRRRRPK